jgi:hypothetical protein
MELSSVKSVLYKKFFKPISEFRVDCSINNVFIEHQEKFKPTLDSIKMLSSQDFETKANLKANLKFFVSSQQSNIHVGNNISNSLINLQS